MQVKISIISLFAIMMISGTIAPSMVFGQYNEGGLGGLTPQYVKFISTPRFIEGGAGEECFGNFNFIKKV